jgi:gas vesicle protein
MDSNEEGMNEVEMEDNDKGERRAASFIAGLLLGAVLGAGIALLVAPDKGTRTRQRIGKQMRSLGESAKEGFDDVAQHATRDLLRRRRRLRHQLDELAREARKTLADAR